MARPSKLTDAQWEKIGKRLLAGEKTADLSREYKVSPAAISQRFSKRTETIKAVANQLVATEQAFGKLNVSEQFAARSLADDLKAISEHLAGAARFGAATAHRLSGIANSRVDAIPDSGSLSEEQRVEMTAVAVLTKMANAASEIPLNLLKANKEKVDELNKGDSSDMHWTLEMVPANAG